MKKMKEFLLSNIGVGVEVDIKKWCKDMKIKKYTLTENFEIIAKESVVLRNIQDLPYKFREVKGSFEIKGSLNSMKNFPTIISERLFFTDTNIEEWSEVKYVGWVIDCSRSKMRSWKGCPEHGNNIVYIKDTNLTKKDVLEYQPAAYVVD